MRKTLFAVLTLSLAANVVLIARLALGPAEAAPSRGDVPLSAETMAQAPRAPAPSTAGTDSATPTTPATAAAPLGKDDPRRKALLREIAELREDLAVYDAIEPRMKALLLAKDLRPRLVALLALPAAERSAALDGVLEFTLEDEGEQAATLLAQESDPALLTLLGEYFERCEYTILGPENPLDVVALIESGSPRERRLAAAAAVAWGVRHDHPDLDARLSAILVRESDPALATALVRTLHAIHDESLPDELRPAVAGALDRLLPGEVRRQALVWVFRSSSEPGFDPLEPYRRWRATDAADVRADVSWAMARLRVDSFDDYLWGDDEEKARVRRDEAWRGFLSVYETTADAPLRDDLFLAAIAGLSLIDPSGADASVAAALRELAAREPDASRATRYERAAKGVEQGELLRDDEEFRHLERERRE